MQTHTEPSAPHQHNEDLPRLTSVPLPWLEPLLSDPSLLYTIADQVQGPYHCLVPDIFATNLQQFERVYTNMNITGRTYYGKKANKAHAWLPIIEPTDAGVDVASHAEFTDVINHGIPGTRIGVTGAAKPDGLLRAAIAHRATIAIDAPDELIRLTDLITEETTPGSPPVPVLLRRVPHTNPHSRFGMHDHDLHWSLAWCSHHQQNLHFRGFSFHLDGYSVATRVIELRRELALCDKVQNEYGLRVSAISIGGGFAAQYVHRDDWDYFTTHLSPDWFHARRTFAGFYPNYQSPTGADMLTAIMCAPAEEPLTGIPENTDSLADVLREKNIDLFVEPGRALVMGAGCSVFPVLGHKTTPDGYGITTVHGLSMSLSEQWKGSEYLPDPILITPTPRPGSPTATCVGGGSCMEYDMLSWRKICLPHQPQRGDLLVYPNTAGYQMDKNESSFHQNPLPPKIVIDTHNPTTWRYDQ